MTPPDPLEDARIRDRFADGHEDALRHVQGWVEGVVHLGRWSFDDAQGVVQDTMVKLLRVVRSGRFESRSTFKTFVFSVAKHTCIDVYRRERLRRRVESPGPPAFEPADAGADPGAPLLHAEGRELLAYVIQRLPDDCRRLWAWVYADGLAATEVASRLGITPGHARVRVHRCLEKARVIGRAFLEGTVLMEPGP